LPLFITDDGSHSIQSEMFGTAYHSVHGAIQESKHVFIEAGLKNRIDAAYQEISILEMGLGTGLNLFLSFLESIQHPNLFINYTAYEMYPVSEIEASELNFSQILDAEIYKDVLWKAHTGEWAKPIKMADKFYFEKLNQDILQIDTKNKYDLIYYDAFSPQIQPELWSAAAMSKMYEALRPNGILVTYCAQGELKRTLRATGFKLSSLPGPKMKREMTLALKID
jgi:tRNA U34 5-methylaminomethyl-2-thiouridine-forming methyltransferase MnmC